MMNTYERPAMLRSAVEHYYQCSAVASVRVVWCEKGAIPATDNWCERIFAGLSMAVRLSSCCHLEEL